MPFKTTICMYHQNLVVPIRSPRRGNMTLDGDSGFQIRSEQHRFKPSSDIYQSNELR